MNDEYIVHVYLMNGKMLKSIPMDKGEAYKAKESFEKGKIFQLNKDTSINSQYVIWIEVVEAVKSKIIKVNN